MTDEGNRPDDVVEGFDLPGGEPTPPPEDETPPDEGGSFDMPAGEEVPPAEAPATAPVAEGFDLPAAEPVPPPDTAAPAPTPLLKRTSARRTSVMGKFIALIIIPLVAIPVILYVMSKRKEEAESYKDDYVATAQRYLKLLSDAREAGHTDDGADLFLEAMGLLSDTMRRSNDPQDLDDHFRKAAAEVGRFVELVDVQWQEPPPGTPYTTFSATAKFESGSLGATFALGGIRKSIRIKSYTLGSAAKSRPPAPGKVFDYEREYTTVVSAFLKALSGGDAEGAHVMLSTSAAEKTDAAKLSDDFRKAAGELGSFSSLEDVQWDPVVAQQSASFRARAVFQKGSIEVWFRVHGMMSIRITEYRFGART